MTKKVLRLLHVNSQPGFTLIELLVVISIIGILSSIVLIAINPSNLLKKARDSKRKSDLQTISEAISHYQLTHDQIPEGGYSTYTPTGGTGTVTVGFSNQPNFLQNLVDDDLFTKNPTDPINSSSLNYKYTGYINAYIPAPGWQMCGGYWVTTCNGFMIYTFLENGYDPDGFIYNFPAGLPCVAYNGQRAVGPGGTVMYLVKQGTVAY